MSLSKERLAQIRALGDDELRTHFDMDRAVDDLLSEVDDLRGAVRSLAVLLRSSADRVAAGGRPDIVALHRAAARANEIVGGS